MKKDLHFPLFDSTILFFVILDCALIFNLVFEIVSIEKFSLCVVLQLFNGEA